MFPDPPPTPPPKDEGWRTPAEHPSSPEAAFCTPENIKRRVYRRLVRRKKIKERKAKLKMELERLLEQQLRMEQLKREERVDSFDATHSAKLESEREQRELERGKVFAELALIETYERNEQRAEPEMEPMNLPPAGPPAAGPSFHFVF
jgi:hypothetical protein